MIWIDSDLHISRHPFQFEVLTTRSFWRYVAFRAINCSYYNVIFVSNTKLSSQFQLPF